jgi:hypothetical protein
MVNIPRLPKVAALTGRRNGSRKRGWKVEMEQITANTDSFISVSLVDGMQELQVIPMSSKHYAVRNCNRSRSRQVVPLLPTSTR